MAKKNSSVSGIVLLAKRPGLTSFSSLNAVKKSLETSKVGHTGTLDSFAQGLLVVCVGNLTRLASHITAFDKSYEAVIEFGSETDTLDPGGTIIKTAPLPGLSELKDALKKFSGTIDQEPPAFSALHVDGQRASDLVRKGQPVKLKSRPVTVFDYEILEVKSEGEKVKYARIRFDVSKGTYIRSLARDIALACGSAGHLEGLLRTRIGCFDLREAAGFDLLEGFTIDSVIKKNRAERDDERGAFRAKSFFDDEKLFEQIKLKIKKMDFKIAQTCGLKTAVIKDDFIGHFKNGRLLKSSYFDSIPADEEAEAGKETEKKYAVFSKDENFLGVILFCGEKIKYEYVISDN